MSEKPIRSKIKIIQKNSKKFVGILRRLAQSENLINNKIKVIVSEGEIIDESDHIFIAPSRFKDYSEKFFERISNDKTSVNTAEESNVEDKISSSNIEKVEYPDSSDLSDNE